MVNIHLYENYYLESDSNSFKVVQRVGINSKGEEVKNIKGYYSSPERAIKGLQLHLMKASEATSFEQLLEENRKFIVEVGKKVGLNG